ncbi:FecR family protein [Chitinophaga jiangningensis]|uniref:FecR family protein n=1 Tax=Chitinophaga jiangningensis TaxID=1419482 RepID=A0A1M7FPK7_9BACT|nr:FecR family protein [Chitinophaga jiangningensis]SHM05984.1 FecR family protein [Chitinophaga jiangningensis]
MIHEKLAAIAEKIADGTATKQQIETYHALLDTLEESEQWDETLMGSQQETATLLKARIYENAGITRKVQRIRMMRLSVAASAALLIGLTTMLWLHYKQPAGSKQMLADHTAGQHVVLKLANGREITLSNDSSVITQGSSTITLAKGGATYHNSAAAPDEINELITPPGFQFMMVLGDGTKVWLNTASRLRFPAAFHGPERVVELTGEAYFEIAQNVNMPFVVKSNEKTVRVLGTSFNLMSYADEPTTNITLLNGAVKVYHKQDSLLLHPGQQARMTDDKGITLIPHADISSITAWKNGYFAMQGENTAVILRQIARWYNLDIEYTGNIPDLKFEGSIKKSYELQDVIAILSESGIHLKLEHKKLVVFPN